MQNEARKVLIEVKDRRILTNPAEAFGDYWPTYGVAVIWSLLYFYGAHEKKAEIFMLFFGVLMIALSAARDAKKEVHRKLDAIVRRMENKELI